MDLGYDVDSQPLDHLSPETECVVVYHILGPARAPVLEHSARPCSGKRRNICISTPHCVSTFPFLRAVHNTLYSALWPQTLGKCGLNVWNDSRKEHDVIADARTSGYGVVYCSKIFDAGAVRKTVVARLRLLGSKCLMLPVTWTVRVESQGVFWPAHPWDLVPLGVAKFIPGLQSLREESPHW
jgi:hypothetical protein